MSTVKPMPADAKMVFKGEIFEVWQWDQELYDGSRAIFERLRRPDTAVVVPVLDGSIVVVDEEQPDAEPFVSVPSGRIEEGEDPFEAAKRELKEETGLESEDWIPWMQVRPVGKIEWTIFVFIARGCRKASEQKLDAGEKIAIRPVSFDDFLALSDDSTFRSAEIVDVLLRARIDPAKKADLHVLLFKA